jgi:hypothetical protein
MVKLLAYIEEAAPSQQIGEFTPEVWLEIIPASFTLDECRAAAAAIIRRGGRYIDLGPLIDEVRKARRPAEDAWHLESLLDPAAYRAGIEAADADTEATLARIADRARLRGARRHLKAIPPPDDGQAGNAP